MTFDTIIINGRIVTATGILKQDVQIGINDGKIAALGCGLDGLPHHPRTKIVDAEGAYITPGGVDSHVHIEQDNSPTGDNWETGSRSAIAGGTTTVIAFVTQNRDDESIFPALKAYHKKAEGNSYCHYGFHVILTNPTEQVLEHELPQLVEKEGISSIKLYMTYEPMKLGDADLFNVMMRARSLGITTMIHAENSDMIAAITERLARAGNTGTFFHSVARPQIAESEATYRAISLAEVTDAPILLVHMSAPKAVQHVADAQSRLLPIHAETCPHYLYLLSEKLRSGLKDVEGSKNICAPPLRHDAKDLEEIWRSVANGTFTTISSDHAPATFDHPCGKKGKAMGTAKVDGHGCVHSDFRGVPNGLPGIETRLPLIFDRTFDPTTGQKPDDDKIRISLQRFVELTSTNPANLYGLGHCKGSILPGFDADLVIWYPEEPPVPLHVPEDPSSLGYIGNKDTSAPKGKTARKIRITNDMLHHSIDYTPFEGVEAGPCHRHSFAMAKLASFFLFSPLVLSGALAAFVHPGLLVTDSDITRAKTKIEAGLDPWLSSWYELTNSTFAQAGYTNGAVDVVYRGSDGVHADNGAALWHDAAAAFALALRWKITGNTTFADTAAAVLRAWGSTLTGIGVDSDDMDNYLLAGFQGSELANAAELLRDYQPFADDGLDTVIDMMNTVFLPMNLAFLNHELPAEHVWTHFFANWELGNMASAMAIAVLSENATTWDFVVDYFKNGGGNGNINLAVSNLVEEPDTGVILGQGQESGRDQGHSALDQQMLGVVAQQAWNQGEDLFSYNNSRILQGAEYFARYNLGHDVPFVNYTNSIVYYSEVSASSRGATRPTWELLYNHYVQIKGMDAPWTTQYLNYTVNSYGGFEPGAGSLGEGSGRYDGLGWGSLLYHMDASDVAAYQSAGTTKSSVVATSNGTSSAASTAVSSSTSSASAYATKVVSSKGCSNKRKRHHHRR